MSLLVILHTYIDIDIFILIFIHSILHCGFILVNKLFWYNYHGISWTKTGILGRPSKCYLFQRAGPVGDFRHQKTIPYIYIHIYIWKYIYMEIYIYIYIEDDHQWSWYWGWDSHNSLVFHNDTLLGIEILFHYGNPILNLSNQYFMDQGKLALCRPKPAVAAHRPRNLAVGA